MVFIFFSVLVQGIIEESITNRGYHPDVAFSSQGRNGKKCMFFNAKSFQNNRFDNYSKQEETNGYHCPSLNPRFLWSAVRNLVHSQRMGL